MQNAVRYEIGPDRVMTVWLDLPDKSVNTMSVRMWTDLDAAVARIESEKPAAVIFASAKPKSFIAGADLFEMRAMNDAQLDEYLAKGQKIYDRIEALPMPTVAAINGDALGGGFELALACKSRIAIDEQRIQIGLPETKLGLVPGWGGTIRLPRLIGVSEALKLMCTGKSVSPPEALKFGMVDEIIPRNQLLEAAKKRATSQQKPTGSAVGSRDADRSIRAQILDKARSDTRARSGENLPAPLRLIDIVELSYEGGIEAASNAERRGLIDLRNSEAGMNLMRLFFLRTGAKKAAAEQAKGKSCEVKSVAVIGGGTMGAGIAHALIRSGLDVQVIEADDASVRFATARITKLLESDQKASRPQSAGPAALQISTDWSRVSSADLVIEAVLEQMRVKLDVFRRLDELVRPDAILASNTSSLSITEIAEATRHPDRVIGLHFFNPVQKMPLVEVVRTRFTNPDALGSGVAIASKLGKTPIVVNDSPGFIVNRVLLPYLREALVMLAEGAPVEQIDRAIKTWGMPMGPFELMDEIGLDVTRMILESLSLKLGTRLSPPPVLERALARKWFGKKTGQGFYVHLKDAKPAVNHELVDSVAQLELSVEEIQNRLMKPMADEAKMVMQEGVVDSPDAIDLATVLGLGFAPFRGGLARFAGLS